MDSDWEVFIAKDERHRCPDGFHKHPETGQCVDANGNVYEEPVDEQPVDENTEQTDETVDGESDEQSSENTDEEQTEESTEDEEDIDEDTPKEEVKPKKSALERIDERTTKLKDWVAKTFGSFDKLSSHSSKSQVVWYTAVAMPILALAKALNGVTGTFRKIVGKREQKKENDDKRKATIDGFNKGLEEVYKSIGIDEKQAQGHKWTKKDVARMNIVLDKRLGELIESKAIKKLMADRAEGLDPKETGSIFCAEYGELRAIMNVMKQANLNLDTYYQGCVDRQIKNIEENRQAKKIIEDRQKQLRAMRVKGNADANTLRHTYDKQNGYKLRTRE